MKIFNILIFFGILITTNVYAGGVYGTLYNKSDLISDKTDFEVDQEKKKLNAKREKKFIYAIEYSEATIDLEKFIVSTSYKVYNKKQSKYAVDHSSQVQCSLQKWEPLKDTSDTILHLIK